MTTPSTAADLLQIACRLPQPRLVVALGLARDGYEPGATFTCPRCQIDGAYEVSTWAWTCTRGRHSGTVAVLALLAAQRPETIAALLAEAQVA